MIIEVVGLREEHLEPAAGLTCSRYKRFCDQMPLLPPRYSEVSTLLPLLHDIFRAGRGVAAIRQGRLVGFLTGWPIPSFRGKRAVYSPEWANAADVKDSRRIYEEMYTHLSASWVEDGYLTHLIGALADDCDTLNVWHWFGFGMIAADAVRSLQPIRDLADAVRIRRGGLQDIEEAVAMSDALQQYMGLAPTFLVHAEKRDRNYYKEWLANPAHALWLAYDGTGPVAFLQQGPANADACTIIGDGKTTSIIGAFTKEELRGGGIASALLNRALDWGRSEGYERCAVDFEPMNPLATRFWLKYFQPVCFTLARQVDESRA